MSIVQAYSARPPQHLFHAWVGRALWLGWEVIVVEHVTYPDLTYVTLMEPFPDHYPDAATAKDNNPLEVDITACAGRQRGYWRSLP